MASNNTKRGFDPKDERFFSKESIINLGIAQEEIQWLLDRNYKIGTVINFVGDHYWTIVGAGLIYQEKSLRTT
ncbi:MAG TPA: DUF434 domain-containing protein [Oscillospiraceae bacterium]|nr:DUF434 domain-containing protein [Oscillospiraceae bacterium]